MSQPPPTETAPDSPHRPMGEKGSLLVFLVAGLIAGGASLALFTLLHDWHKVPEEFGNISPIDERGQARLRVATAEVATKNLILTISILGAAVAGILGLAGGVRDRSSGRAAAGFLLGLVLGGGLGFASAYLGPELIGPRLDALIPRTAEFHTAEYWKMFTTMAVQATMWGLIGLAAALAATIPARRIGVILSSAVGALVAAMFAMMIYQLLLASVFQTSRFDLYLPQEPGPIVAWTLPVGLLLGLVLGPLSVARETKAA